MKLLPTIEKAKQEILALQNFVLLAEEHGMNNLKDRVIKMYAYTGSIEKVVTEINNDLISTGEQMIDRDFVTDTIKSRPTDSLHKIVRSNYFKKTKHSRLK